MPQPTAAGQILTTSEGFHNSYQDGVRWVWRMVSRSSQVMQMFSRKETPVTVANVTGSYTLDIDALVGDVITLDLIGNATVTPVSLRYGIYPIKWDPNAFTLTWGASVVQYMTPPTPAPDGTLAAFFCRFA